MDSPKQFRKLQAFYKGGLGSKKQLMWFRKKGRKKSEFAVKNKPGSWSRPVTQVQQAILINFYNKHKDLDGFGERENGLALQQSITIHISNLMESCHYILEHRWEAVEDLIVYHEIQTSLSSNTFNNHQAKILKDVYQGLIANIKKKKVNLTISSEYTSQICNFLVSYIASKYLNNYVDILTTTNSIEFVLHYHKINKKRR